MAHDLLHEDLKLTYGEFKLTNELPRIKNGDHVELFEQDVKGEIVLTTREDGVEPMNPSLDYLFQYPVGSVTKTDAGFNIEFASDNPGAGAIIGIEDSSIPVPDLDGKSLITVITSTDGLRLRFGRVSAGIVQDVVEVAVSPTDYFITDPRFNNDQFYPGRYTPEPSPGDSIREQFDGRFADGPTAPVEVETPEEAPEG